MKTEISPHIFRAYDIRGLYQKDISPELFYKIGLATGTYLKTEHNGKHMVVGNDIRQSSPPLTHAFIAGLTATGIKITYTGTTSFGQTLFKGWKQKTNLIAFITASHLPPEWNGIKFYYGDGVGLPEEELNKIRDNTLNETQSLVTWEKIGSVKTEDAKEDYREYFKSKITFLHPLTIAVDCGGASTSLSAPEIFQSIGVNLVPVFCEPDPSFSKRPSDPKPQHLTELIDAVKQHHCDFGVAFDGDGDRSVIVDNQGRVLSADTTGILIGKYGLIRKRGTIIVNVECSKAVEEQLTPLGYSIKKIQVGHTFLTLEAKLENAPLGIESSGHLILPEFFLFDDAVVVPMKIAQILDATEDTLSDLVDTIPTYPTKKLEIECSDSLKFKIIDHLKHEFSQEFNEVNTLDGIRVELPHGWVLIRASNTSPIIRVTAEAKNSDELEKIVSNFHKRTLKKIEKLQVQTT
jgi:phosphomannomutase